MTGDSGCDTSAPMPKRETRDRRVNLRLPNRLVTRIEAEAKTELRSLNSMFEIIVNEWVIKHPKHPKSEGRP
jgi:hypothetical protein